MGWATTWAVKCDGCGATGPVAGVSRVAQELAVRLGWDVGYWKGWQNLAAHLCPGCKGRDVPEFTPKVGAVNHKHTEGRQ